MIRNFAKRRISVPTPFSTSLEWVRKLSNEDRNEPKLPSTTVKDTDVKPTKPTQREIEQLKIKWHLKESQYYNFLRTFYAEDNRVKTMKFLQSKIDLSPSSLKKYFASLKEEAQIEKQMFIPARHRTLGNELAAAHFIVARYGAVKFHNEDVWIKRDEDGKYDLPQTFQEGRFLEAIDGSEMDLYYEGLSNLEGLHNVTWLSLNGCEYIDDWCLDKIANIFSHSLIYLDLRNCRKITERGLVALYKLENLKLLYLDDLLKDTIYEMSCLMLQEVNPYLDIRSTELQLE